jgi:hypothetical protein
MEVKAVICLLARAGTGSKRYTIDFGISTSIESGGDTALPNAYAGSQQGACQTDAFVSYTSTDTERAVERALHR